LTAEVHIGLVECHKSGIQRCNVSNAPR